jgi:hypothetical protein
LSFPASCPADRAGGNDKDSHGLTGIPSVHLLGLAVAGMVFGCIHSGVLESLFLTKNAWTHLKILGHLIGLESLCCPPSLTVWLLGGRHRAATKQGSSNAQNLQQTTSENCPAACMPSRGPWQNLTDRREGKVGRALTPPRPPTPGQCAIRQRDSLALIWNLRNCSVHRLGC